MKRNSLYLLGVVVALLVSACQPFGAQLPPPGGPPGDPHERAVPLSIDQTGVTDVTMPLTNFIRNVPDGSTVVFPSHARYRIEGVIVLLRRNNLRLEGNMSTFFATTTGATTAPPSAPRSLSQHWPRSRGQFKIEDGTNITLRNLIIKGAHPNAGATNSSYVPALEGQAGVDFSGTQSALLEGCQISDTYGDLVYIGSNAQHITVRNCQMQRSGRQGVTVSDGEHVLIANNMIRDIGRTAIDLETYTATWGVRDVTIKDNLIGRAHGYFVAAKGGGDVSDIFITGNALHGQPMGIANRPPSAVSPRRHNWWITNNSSDWKVGSPHAPFLFEHTDHVRVTGNTVPLTAGRGQLSVEFIDCTDAFESGNTFIYR